MYVIMFLFSYLKNYFNNNEYIKDLIISFRHLE